MAGYGIDYHIALQAGFNILFCKRRHRHVQVCGHACVFLSRNINHQALAAVTALRTVNLRGNFCIQPVHHCINVRRVLCL